MSLRALSQILPSSRCLPCEVCCRFPDSRSAYRPFFRTQEIQRVAPTETARYQAFASLAQDMGTHVELVPEGKIYRCPYLNAGDHRCGIYHDRPLDCRLYPFMLAESPEADQVLLTADPNCPWILENLNDPATRGYVDRVAALLEERSETMAQQPGLVVAHQDSLIPLKPLPRLTRAILGGVLGGRRMSLRGRGIFESHTRASISGSFTRSFVPLYLWQDRTGACWTVHDGCFCLFSIHPQGADLLLPPLGEPLTGEVLQQATDLLTRLNPPEAALRVFNLLEKDRSLFEAEGWSVTPQGEEYVSPQEVLAELPGRAFKKKRAACSLFARKYKPRVRVWTREDIPACLALFRSWSRERLQRYPEPYYRMLLEDLSLAQKRAFDEAEALGIQGIVVEVDGAIQGYSLGCPLTDETFCILFEIADLSLPGLAPFLFRECCRSLEGYRYINLMDDSGLENLRQAKRTYHPRIIPLYQAERARG